LHAYRNGGYEMNEKGFTVIEAIIVFAILLILGTTFGSALLNNRGATERRATELATKFLSQNNIKVKRIICAGDSDANGYGTCSVLTTDNEKMFLQCPTEYFDVNFFGVSQCKEVFYTMNILGQ